jgi:hypothetical protein
MIVQPPTRRYSAKARGFGHQPSLFLGGSIEMGEAEDWQAKVIAALKDVYDTIYNPRRDDWDPAWEQSIEHPEFNAQVNWELDMIAEADVVLFYFDPKTKSPITLMELGLALATKEDVAVCCPPGFWRKGNVDIICERFGVVTMETLDQLIQVLN